MNVQLEAWERDLQKVEKETTVAMSHRTEAEALRTKLAAKEKELVRLSSELRELGLRLKDKVREESPHGETTCHKGRSTFAILSIVVAFTKEYRLPRCNVTWCRTGGSGFSTRGAITAGSRFLIGAALSHLSRNIE